MKVDYIIVGAGLAGLAFAERALQKGKKILVFENDSQHSSSVAAGVYNPVVLKRFSRLANAQEQVEGLLSFYSLLERKFNRQLLHPLPIYRRFASIEEQNNWFVASEKVGITPFLDTQLIHDEIEGVESPYGYGKVNFTGYLNTDVYLEAYRNYLKTSESYLLETFDYAQLNILEEHVEYKEWKAEHIVFAEGYGIKNNPYFKDLPLNGTKGEVLEIEIPEWNLDCILKSGVFLLPNSKEQFIVGATYEWDDKTENPTPQARETLEKELQVFLKKKYKITKQKAGIRPTVKDRKPLIGTHPEHKRLHLMNGMGTRGVMLAPYVSAILIDYLEFGTELPQSMNLMRFWNA